MDASLTPTELLQIGRRRLWHMLVPLVVLTAGGVALAVSLPAVYRSSGTILIEDQEVPENLVVSLVGDFVERRLETLSRRILVNDNLLRLAERHDLYAEERQVMSPMQVAELMRKNIGKEVIRTDINDPTTGRTGLATVAFQISFEDGDPAKAQRVANDLVSLYLQTNLEQRRAVASGATTFLAGERQRAEQRLAQLEQEMLAFQSANLGMLPSDVALAQEQIVALEAELRALEGEQRSLQQQEAFLRTQLALTEEFMPAGATPGVTPASQLELTRAELATARARYAPNHPDVQRLEREVQSLQRVVGGGGGAQSLIAEEGALASELAALRQRYTPTHPDVVRVERQLASVRQALAQTSAGGTSGALRSPAFVQLSAQLNAVQSQQVALADRVAGVRAELSRLREVVAQGPAVAQQYERLQRLLLEASTTREELAVKESSAELSRSLEAGAAGERFSLIEPPVFPDEPVRPNRKLIVAIGVLLGVGTALGSATLAEVLDRSVRSAKDLARTIGERPLVMIPNLVTGADVRRRWALRLGVVAVLVAAVLGGLAYVHQSRVPLDVLAYEAQSRANAWWTKTFPTGSPVSRQE